MLHFLLYYNSKDYKSDFELYNHFKIDEIIDYKIISQKITNNDFYKMQPCEKTVSHELFRKLKSIFTDCEKSINFLYVLKDYNIETVDNISSILNDFSKKYSKNTKITIINKTDLNIDLSKCKYLKIHD